MRLSMPFEVTTPSALRLVSAAAYKGARDRAIDVGTCSGVLALQLAKAGSKQVLAADINPNAIESVVPSTSSSPTRRG